MAPSKRLRVTVLTGSRLSTKPQCNLYCTLKLNKDRFKTKSLRGASPVWNEEHVFNVPGPATAFLMVCVKTKGRLGMTRTLGKPVGMRMDTIVQGKDVRVQVPVGAGTLHLTLNAMDFGREPDPEVDYQGRRSSVSTPAAAPGPHRRITESLALDTHKPCVKRHKFKVIEEWLSKGKVVQEIGHVCVWKVNLGDDRVACVQVLEGIDHRRHKKFLVDMNTVAKLQHAAVAPLLGFARQGSRLALVYPWMRDTLADHVTSPAFGWKYRLAVAKDLAEGLAALHKARPAIAHGAVCISNVLLDQYGNAQWGNVGLAQLTLRDTPGSTGQRQRPGGCFSDFSMSHPRPSDSTQSRASQEGADGPRDERRESLSHFVHNLTIMTQGRQNRGPGIAANVSNVSQETAPECNVDLTLPGTPLTGAGNYTPVTPGSLASPLSQASPLRATPPPPPPPPPPPILPPPYPSARASVQSGSALVSAQLASAQPDSHAPDACASDPPAASAGALAGATPVPEGPGPEHSPEQRRAARLSNGCADAFAGAEHDIPDLPASPGAGFSCCSIFQRLSLRSSQKRMAPPGNSLQPLPSRLLEAPPPPQTYYPNEADFSISIDLYYWGLLLLQLLGSLAAQTLRSGAPLALAQLDDLPNEVEWPEDVRQELFELAEQCMKGQLSQPTAEELCERMQQIVKGKKVKPKSCMVCLDTPREARLPCGHCTMCEICTLNVAEQHPECPLCRTPFTVWDLCNGMASFYGSMPTEC